MPKIARTNWDNKVPICTGCKGYKNEKHHRCRAYEDFCKDGKNCPDYVGEGNCGCMKCKESRG
tara:strand:+ start:4886 stop:5074 length:189 start_codon:yes stop_codon:yes gene_type:complete